MFYFLLIWRWILLSSSLKWHHILHLQYGAVAVSPTVCCSSCVTNSMLQLLTCHVCLSQNEEMKRFRSQTTILTIHRRRIDVDKTTTGADDVTLVRFNSLTSTTNLCLHYLLNIPWFVDILKLFNNTDNAYNNVLVSFENLNKIPAVKCQLRGAKF